MKDGWSACLQTLEVHSGPVNSVAFSHDSTRLASASDDSTVKIWNVSSGECEQTLEGHIGYVRSVAFSHDSTRLASASDDRTVKIWNVSSGECEQTLDIGQTLHKISFNTTGSCIHTEIGTITLTASPFFQTADVTGPQYPQYPQYQGGGMSLDRAWITYNDKHMLWLPSEYRPSCSAVLGNNVGIGVGSGRVWICSFHLD
ncbi:WD40 repeat-like protein [Zopfia rhizophila CBS 207.26]|uniref:Mitochondrial division protein 1 n=1 Tax=Zopfia rhizophila CBS 207.26 TaxID=1314779 RepID=A0A6A6EGX3_9PEZI|nr:WD40 repeat-like protein [Zopfia rhizophila CBS 207.26]